MICIVIFDFDSTVVQQNSTAGDAAAFGACFLIHKDVQQERGLEKG